MKDQRNSIGDRAAPAEAPKSIQAPDPSSHEPDGGVERREDRADTPTEIETVPSIHHPNGATR